MEGTNRSSEQVVIHMEELKEDIGEDKGVGIPHVLIDRDIERDMYAAAMAQYIINGGEASGLLVGRFEADVVTVTSAPHMPGESEHSFCRIPPLTAAELAASLPDDVAVVGWWHSHPRFARTPSATDLATIDSMVRSSPLVVSVIVDPLACAMDVYLTDDSGTWHVDGGNG